jgi:hypothetical protein
LGRLSLIGKIPRIVVLKKGGGWLIGLDEATLKRDLNPISAYA